MVKRGKSLRFLALAFILLASTLLACEFSAQVGGGEPSIDEVIMARSLDDSQKPVDPTSVFGPEDVFNASAKVSNLEKDSKVTGKWFFGDEFIDEASVDITEDGFTGYVGFNLSPSAPWPPGDYRLEVYLGDELAKTATFQASE